jgi:hypothetical protein
VKRLVGDEFGAVVRPGEQVLSCDLSVDGVWALAVDDGSRTTVRFSSGVEVVMREHHGSLEVAVLDADRAVVVIPRTAAQSPNAWVVGSHGSGRKFFVGDAVQDLIAVSDEEVAVTYFDEGFGAPVSEEGVAVFGPDGSLRDGFVSSGGEPIMDCYAAVEAGPWTVGFLPYTSWHLTEWNIATGTDRSHVVPGSVRGADAITRSGDRWWFFSPYERRHKVFEWREGSAKVSEVGVIRGPLRGLSEGRFLEYTEGRPRVLSMASPD